mmetsp:Transcript_15139/g.26873  ORF Transcript_15139/g.26873 Transcript_15139/m.26873 type:complete len:99 (-) Transcript_15139:3-299(-)
MSNPFTKINPSPEENQSNADWILALVLFVIMFTFLIKTISKFQSEGLKVSRKKERGGTTSEEDSTTAGEEDDKEEEKEEKEEEKAKEYISLSRTTVVS